MAIIQNLFPTYELALTACGKGYNDDDIAVVVARKTAIISSNIMQGAIDTDPSSLTVMAVSIAQRDSKTIRVLDIGGACGYAYFVTKALIGHHANIQWVVVETEAMVRQANLHFHTDNLKFCTSIEEGIAVLGGRDCIDIVHTSGTIQYVPYPEKMLDNILGICAPVVLIARFPLYGGSRCVGVQTSLFSDNGPGPMPEGIANKQFIYPVTFINTGDLAQRVLSSYQIIGQFLSPSANYTVGPQQAPGISILLRYRAT